MPFTAQRCNSASGKSKLSNAAQSGNNAQVEWAPLGYYCSHTGRLYKHRSEGASHHTGEPCCQPVVRRSDVERIAKAAERFLERLEDDGTTMLLGTQTEAKLLYAMCAEFTNRAKVSA